MIGAGGKDKRDNAVETACIILRNGDSYAPRKLRQDAALWLMRGSWNWKFYNAGDRKVEKVEKAAPPFYELFSTNTVENFYYNL